MRRIKKQLELTFKSWGGRRKGAGRKKTGARPRTRRPSLSDRHPVHVTVRLESGLPSLRQKPQFKVVKALLDAARERLGMRIVHYSVQSNHLHLLVEAADRRALTRGMKGLGVRLARQLNQSLNRTGRVLRDRFHARALKTPREVRNALVYVLQNARRHAAQGGRTMPVRWLDPCSTSESFGGWLRCRPKGPAMRPDTWLLRVGWLKRGAIATDELPAGT